VRRSVLTLLIISVVALAGCTTAGSTSSKKFTGPANDVSKAISDLQSAAQRKDSGKICSQLLAGSLVTKLGGPGTACGQEVDKAISDADEYSLDVQTINVTGDQATARVRQGSDGRTKQVTLVREAGAWKVAGVS
jgi:hypothetical protein